MSGPNEFSRAIKLTDIGTGETVHEISANEAERTELAERFELFALSLMTAKISLSRNTKGIQAKGQLRCELAQTCTATGEAVAEIIDEEIDVIFVSPPTEDGDVELESGECDTMFHDGKLVDLGEAAAQTMGLALNPYPRSKRADAKLRAAGVKSEDEERAVSGPFAALAALKEQK